MHVKLIPKDISRYVIETYEGEQKNNVKILESKLVTKNVGQ